MKSTRRTVLKSMTALAIALATRLGLAKTVGSADTATTLAAFLDTLIPADELSPSASSLGLADSVLQSGAGEAYGRLLQLGCAWLDQQAREAHGVDFAQLDPAARVGIVRRAEQSQKNTMQHVFFRAVRDDTARRYYADPGTWPALGYHGPPQPVGFPDFAKPLHGSRAGPPA